MHKLLACLLLYCGLGHAQQLHHQMLSAQGNSAVLANGTYVSQTIGQQSVIGNYTREGKTYGQGFQQSMWGSYIKRNATNTITTTTYPNPFVDVMNFEFSQAITDKILVQLFDVRGRLVFSTSQKAEGTLLTVNLPNLATSNYLVHLTTPSYSYYTQILKHE
ncbi:MAG: T9SS type A sorting domain-containing protein [Flavobacterium psychrophilum]